MRQGQQHRRGRGRNNNNNNNNNSHSSSGSSSNSNNNNNHRKGQNPLTRSFESNGPDVKVRGTPAHVAEKYMTLARDAQTSGDPVLAENYLQHAEHYNRIILAYREQQGQLGGDGVNGGRPARVRSEFGDGDEGHEDGASDDPGQGDQPVVTRFPAEPSRTFEGGRGEAGRGDERAQDGQTADPPYQQQGRFRDRPDRQRHERQDRPNNDRPDRQERFNRNDRQDRPDRQDRGGDRPERAERFDRGPDRPSDGATTERAGDERAVEPSEPRESRQTSEPRESRQTRDPRESRQTREPREPRETSEPREPRAPRERPTDEQPMVDNAAPRSDASGTRAEPQQGRRRERFAPGDQPDFLRRPVRRPRREAEPGSPPEPAATTDEPPRE